MQGVPRMELLEAMTHPFCPLCRVLRIADERQVWSYLYEHSMDPESRRRFDASLGFCRHHAALAAMVVQERELVAGATIALFYESVIGAEPLSPTAVCPICEVGQARVRGEALAFARLLESHWEAYEASAGLCLPHLRELGQGQRLQDDQQRRMKRLRKNLRELHRKQAHDVKEAPTKEEQESWREALWRFTGVHWDGPLVKRR